MSIRKALLAFAVLLTLTGCQQRYNTQEAYQACEGLLPADAKEEVLLECVACHENCGPDCDVVGDAPDEFACPDEQDGGGGGG